MGLSYSRTPADYHTNDTQTALDADAFLRGWFGRFPHYGDNEFYISGESYAGVYGETLRLCACVRSQRLGRRGAFGGRAWGQAAVGSIWWQGLGAWGLLVGRMRAPDRPSLADALAPSLRLLRLLPPLAVPNLARQVVLGNEAGVEPAINIAVSGDALSLSLRYLGEPS